MKGKVQIIVAMFFMQFFLSATGAIPGPLLATIAASLRVTDPTLLGLIGTLPTLTLIPTNLLSGFLATRMSKKTLFFIGATLFIIGGIGPIFTMDINVFLIFRAILGLGSGFVFPLGFAMIPDYFEGDAQQKATGIFNAGGLALAVPLAFIAAAIGGTIWQNGMWLYAAGIIPMLLVLFFIPNKKPVRAAADAIVEKADPPHKSTYITAVVGLVYFLGITIASISAALYLASIMPVAAVAGVAAGATALFAIGGMIASFMYAKLVKWFDKWVGFIFFTLGAVGLFLMFIVPSATSVLIAMLLCGTSVGATGPVMVMGAMNKSYWSVPLTTAIVLTGFNVGQFLSPFAMGTFSRIGHGSWPFVYLCASVVVALIAVYYFIVTVKPEKDD